MSVDGVKPSEAGSPHWHTPVEGVALDRNEQLRGAPGAVHVFTVSVLTRQTKDRRGQRQRVEGGAFSSRSSASEEGYVRLPKLDCRPVTSQTVLSDWHIIPAPAESASPFPVLGRDSRTTWFAAADSW